MISALLVLQGLHPRPCCCLSMLSLMHHLLSVCRYAKFLLLHKHRLDLVHPVPTADISLMWHAHMSNSGTYGAECLELLGRLFEDLPGGQVSREGLRSEGLEFTHGLHWIITHSSLRVGPWYCNECFPAAELHYVHSSFQCFRLAYCLSAGGKP